MRPTEQAGPDRRKQFKELIRKIPMWLKWGAPILIVAAIAGLLIANAGHKPPTVSIYQTKIENIEKNVFASGHLEPLDEQSFFTPADSTLMELKVKVGDRVKKGEVLGRLDTLELGRKYKDAMAGLAGKEAELAKLKAVNDDLDLRLAESDYARAKNKLNRMKALRDAGAASQEEVEVAEVDLAKTEAAYRETKIKKEEDATGKQRDSLQAQVELARQEVAQAKEHLDLATFVADEDGVVTFVSTKEGNRVLEGTLLMTIGGDQNLEVAADINEIDAGSLMAGQEAEIKSVALPGKSYSGIVSRVGAAAIKEQNATSGAANNVPVTISLQGDTKDLKIGYTVNLNITILQDEKVLTLPLEAVVDRGDQKVVYAVEGSTVKERQVKTRLGNELKDIVISGLEPGDKVILDPPPTLKAGQEVTVQQDKGQGRPA